MGQTRSSAAGSVAKVGGSSAAHSHVFLLTLLIQGRLIVSVIPVTDILQWNISQSLPFGLWASCAAAIAVLWFRISELPGLFRKKSVPIIHPYSCCCCASEDFAVVWPRGNKPDGSDLGFLTQSSLANLCICDVCPARYCELILGEQQILWYCLY